MSFGVSPVNYSDSDYYLLGEIKHDFPGHNTVCKDNDLLFYRCINFDYFDYQ